MANAVEVFLYGGCMANCNCMKDRHYKSSTQFYNTTSQVIGSAMAPLTLLGTEVTDTGVSLDTTSNAVEIQHSGLYRITGAVGINVTTAGNVTVQIYADGVPLSETARIITASAGYHLISVDTIRQFRTFCGQNPASVQIMVMGDGTAAGDVTFVSGNVLKEA